MKEIKLHFSLISLIYQIPKYQFSSDLLNFIRECFLMDGFLDYVLVDGSGGKGSHEKFHDCLEIMKTVNTGNPRIGLGYVGGLGPETVDILLDGLLPFQAPLLLDAQNGIANADGLDVDKALSYIRAILYRFETHR